MQVIRRPFFSYYGSKWRAAKHYPAPQHASIVEPFAGGAGYALHHASRNVTLYDIDPAIIGVWNYLIDASERDICRLPVKFESTEHLRIAQEAKWLIGFWLGIGSQHPRLTPATSMRKRLAGLTPVGTGGGNNVSSFWCETTRDTLASQVKYIRHWKAFCQSFASIRNKKATWFVDPPYDCKAGRAYRFHDIDYKKLAGWCQDRRGQTIVCETAGAEWLPFQSLKSIRSVRGWSKEVIYTCTN